MPQGCGPSKIHGRTSIRSGVSWNHDRAELNRLIRLNPLSSKPKLGHQCGMKSVFLAMMMSVGISMAAEVVSVEKAEKLIADKVQLLDVRTQEEWDEGHLEGAVRADVTEKDFETAARKVTDPQKPLLVYCRSGGRSARAAKKLEKMGYKVVYDMDGGITAWKKADKKVVK